MLTNKGFFIAIKESHKKTVKTPFSYSYVRFRHYSILYTIAKYKEEWSSITVWQLNCSFLNCTKNSMSAWPIHSKLLQCYAVHVFRYIFFVRRISDLPGLRTPPPPPGGRLDPGAARQAAPGRGRRLSDSSPFHRSPQSRKGIPPPPLSLKFIHTFDFLHPFVLHPLLFTPSPKFYPVLPPSNPLLSLSYSELSACSWLCYENNPWSKQPKRREM